MQQGIHTAKNKKIKMVIYENQFKDSALAMIIWNNDAQVLKRTCPA